MDNKNIDTLEKELMQTKKEIEKARRIEEKDKCANEIREQYDSFVKAGFTEEQAWELTFTLVSNGTKR